MRASYKIEIATGPTIMHALAALEAQVQARMAEGYDSLNRVQVYDAPGGAVAFKEMVKWEYDEPESEPVKRSTRKTRGSDVA